MKSKAEVLKKMWRESATLLVLGRSVPRVSSQSDCNYKVLVMKRSKQTSFMPNSFVFPGGVIEKTDDSSDWIQLYKQLAVASDKFTDITSVKGPRPFLFQNKEEHTIPREVSLRITAIRETFEELGLLLVKDCNQFKESKSFATYSQVDVSHWQNEIHNDSSKFYQLCKQMNMAPDLWSCYEWAAWLTPSNLKARFETAFFLVALDDQPELCIEKNEVQEYMWETPRNLLKMYAADKIWLPPPQYYELSRLYQINDIDKVVEFAKARNNEGITLHYPICYKATDGAVYAYPGDEIYPTDPCFTHTTHDANIFEQKSCKEIRDSSKKLHRFEQKSPKSELYMNIEPVNGHLRPLLDD